MLLARGRLIQALDCFIYCKRLKVIDAFLNLEEDLFMQCHKLNLLVASLAFTVGVLFHASARLIWGEYALGSYPYSSASQIVSAPSMKPQAQAVDPCAEAREVLRTGVMIRAIPSSVLIKCGKLEEGKAHPPAQVEAHSRQKQVLPKRWRSR
jgi:hypothetical protein